MVNAMSSASVSDAVRDPAAGSNSEPSAGVVESRPSMRRTFYSAAIYSAQPVFLSALMLPVTAYVIRSLGPTQYGQWATATTLAAAVAFLTNPGLRGTFVR